MLRTLPDSRQIRALLSDGTARRALIVGAGFIGLEMAETSSRAGYLAANTSSTDNAISKTRELTCVPGPHLAINV